MAQVGDTGRDYCNCQQPLQQASALAGYAHPYGRPRNRDGKMREEGAQMARDRLAEVLEQRSVSMSLWRHNTGFACQQFG